MNRRVTLRADVWSVALQAPLWTPRTDSILQVVSSFALSAPTRIWFAVLTRLCITCHTPLVFDSKAKGARVAIVLVYATLANHSV